MERNFKLIGKVRIRSTNCAPSAHMAPDSFSWIPVWRVDRKRVVVLKTAGGWICLPLEDMTVNDWGILVKPRYIPERIPENERLQISEKFHTYMLGDLPEIRVRREGGKKDGKNVHRKRSCCEA